MGESGYTTHLLGQFREAFFYNHLWALAGFLADIHVVANTNFAEGLSKIFEVEA